MADACCGSSAASQANSCCGTPAALTPVPEVPKAVPAASCGTGADSACGCSGGVPVFDGVDPRYKRVLWTVIALNGIMFAVEMVMGHLAGSQALQADALDFLGDTVTYGLSLAVIGASLRARATAALFKGLSLSLMAVWVLGSTVYQTLILGVPQAELMGGIGLLALATNLTSVLLLMRYKDGDATCARCGCARATTRSATWS